MAGDSGEEDPLSSSGETSDRPPSSWSRSSLLGRCLQCFNLTAISGLTVAVVFLFLQLQVVSIRVAQESSQIKQIMDQMSSQQAQTQDLNVKVDQEHDLTILHMAGTFTLLTGIITMFHMSNHLRNFHEPFVQRKIITILWMSPVYSITSFLSLLWPPMEGYLSIVKDFYEAYVIYMFLSFLIAVLGRGDRQMVVDIVAQHAEHLKDPAKCLSPWYHPPPGESPRAKANAVILECQILALQFVFCRPITSIVSFVVTTLSEVNDTSAGSLHDTSSEDASVDDIAASSLSYFASPLFWIAMVQNVSVFLAFRGMIKFYHVVRDDLAWCQPFPKFLAIKGVVFMTFWQGLVISIIVHLHQRNEWAGTGNNAVSPREEAAMMQNILICLEMLFFSIAHWCVFPTDEWEPGYRPRQYAKPGIGIKDFVDDLSFIAESRRDAKRHHRARNGSDSESQNDASGFMAEDNESVADAV